MKFSIDIECTPEEARALFGMPSVEAFNQKLMEEVQARMMEHVRTMDPEALAKTWFPAGAKAWEQMAEAFAAGFAGTRPTKK
jgi:hypothetical protein